MTSQNVSFSEIPQGLFINYITQPRGEGVVLWLHQGLRLELSEIHQGLFINYITHPRGEGGCPLVAPGLKVRAI